MAKDDIPVKESTNRGVPVTDVRSAQAALQGMMSTPNEEQSTEDQEETETTEEVSAQDTESESVEVEADNPDGLTADDLVDQDQAEEGGDPTEERGAGAEASRGGGGSGDTGGGQCRGGGSGGGATPQEGRGDRGPATAYEHWRPRRRKRRRRRRRR